MSRADFSCNILLVATFHFYFQILESKKNEHDEAQNRIIESSIRSAELSGVHLEGPLKEEFNQITQQLAELGTKFQ